MNSIRTIQRFLEKQGVTSQVFESAPNRGNLVSRIRGVDEGPKLMFGPSHVDVAEVKNADDWDEPPFSGFVKEGYVWGRGALDMLFIVVAQVQAFVELHCAGFQPRGDLILLLVCDEEEKGKYGMEWMLNNYPDLVETDYAVTEAGGWPLEPGKFALTIGEEGTPDSQNTGQDSFSLTSPVKSRFVDAMEDAVKKEVPNSTLVPLTMPGRTDAGFLRRKGSQVYGFALFDPETKKSELAVHGVNERIRIKTLDLTVRVYINLARDFLKRK
ncbi:MAG: M20/M25/M40 family metallo-hydrolase [Candidatus Bathyarchaeota archaeon]|nr:M20/M25/M40 family metallo-hydrolase [Candidatus Bathyarchaeota archaeon]